MTDRPELLNVAQLTDAGNEPPTIVPEEPEPLPELPAERDALRVLADTVERLAADSQRYHARAEQREAVIKQLHEELQVVRRGERRGMLRPLLTEVARLREDIRRQAATLPADYDAVKARDLLLSYADSLEIALADNGVSAYRPEPGDPFESRTHRPVGREPSAAVEQVGTIASVRRDGYRDLETGQLLAPAEVSVYVLTDPAPLPADASESPATHRADASEFPPPDADAGSGAGADQPASVSDSQGELIQ
jgi:molecular chaperone GrpE (heat shock protein)